MSDTNNPPSDSNEPGATPDAETPPPAEGATPDATPETPLGEPGKAALDAERKARRDAERKLKALEEAQRERELAEMGELERLQTQLAERETQLEAERQARRDAVLRGAFEREATAAGVPSDLADLAYESVRQMLEVAEDGTPSGVGQALDALKTTRPGLFHTSTGQLPVTPQGSTNAGAGSQPDPSTLHLKPEEAAMAKRFGLTPAQWVEAKKANPDPSKLKA